MHQDELIIFRNLKELPIAQDIPRFAKKISVYDKQATLLNLNPDELPIEKKGSDPHIMLQKKNSMGDLKPEGQKLGKDPTISRAVFQILSHLSNEVEDLK